MADATVAQRIDRIDLADDIEKKLTRAEAITDLIAATELVNPGEVKKFATRNAALAAAEMIKEARLAFDALWKLSKASQ